MRPRIGITASTRREGERPTTRQNRAYIDAVADVGGLPLVLPVLEPTFVDDVLASIDGLLLTGGADIDPACYGQAAHPTTAGVDRERDVWELALVRAAIERGVPLLAICRGQQVLNVACGGTLVQHLPEITDLPHRDADGSGSGATVHTVDVEADSVLRRVVDAERLATNSSHHQAVDRIGAGLRACAWAPDGTIEGIEPAATIEPDATADGGERPIVGVQWHPETLTSHASHRALFRWLVDTATATASTADASRRTRV